MACNITEMGTNASGGSKTNWGCCLKDQTNAGGGYCMIVNDSDNDIDTFWLSDTQFDTVEAYTA